MNPYMQIRRRYLTSLTTWMSKSFGAYAKIEVSRTTRIPDSIEELNAQAELVNALQARGVSCPLFLRMIAEGSLHLDHAANTLRLTILNYRAHLKSTSTAVVAIDS